MSQLFDVVVGIDVGLTSLKVAAFTSSGRLVASAQRKTPAFSQPGGGHEVDMSALWEEVASALREVVVAGSESWQVTAVGVTGHGNGLYPLDSAGAPTRAAITSSDTRAAALVEGLSPAARNTLRKTTGSYPWPGQPLVLLAWLAAQEPEAFAATSTVLGCKDWVRYCLTGATGMDRTDASASGLLRPDGRDYALEMFGAFGLPASAARLLPALHDSDAVAGVVHADAAAATMLAQGTPVASGALDCVAGVIAAAGIEVGDTTLIVGTWAISAVVGRILPSLGDILMVVPLPGNADLRIYLNSAPASCAALDWVLEMLQLPKEEALAAAATIAPGSDGLLFLPFVHGLPELPAATGSFIGMRTHHTPAHLVRAVLEGVAHYYRMQLRCLETSGATSAGVCRLIGGGARSALWAQIFADVLQRYVLRVDGSELGARGAALLAIAATSGGSVSKAVSAADQPSVIVAPSGDVGAYEAQAAEYDRWFASASEIWKSPEGRA